MKRRVLSMLLCVAMALSLLPMSALAADDSNWIEVAGIVGGKIDFDESTGTIVECEQTVTKADIPQEINGVTVTAIDYGAFSDCTSLEWVKIPETATKIDYGAFRYCTSLKKVIISRNTTDMGYNGESGWGYRNCGVFTGCTQLKTAGPIGSGCNIEFGWDKTIPKDALHGCDGLESITIPEGVSRIEDAAFAGCKSLNTLSLPMSLTSVAGGVIADTALYENEKNWNEDILYISNWILAVKYDIAGKHTIKEETVGIADSVFQGSAITSIIMPDSLRYIGKTPFTQCLSLEDVTLSSGLSSICENAFDTCWKLSRVYIPDSVTRIEKNAFIDCKSLSSLSIPKNVTYIGENAFRGCGDIEGDCIIPDSVSYIGKDAFLGTKFSGSFIIGNGLKEMPTKIGYKQDLIIGNGITEIPQYYQYVGTGVLKVGKNVKKIGSYAFGQHYTSSGTDTVFSKVILPESVTDIGYEIFGSYSNLESAGPLGSGCDYEFGWKTSIPPRAFESLHKLNNVVIPNGIISIGDSAFSSCTSLETIALPDNIKNIGNYTFSGCKNLASIKLPDNIKNIGNYAFSGCKNLASIKLPESIEKIGDSAFKDCANLTSIALPNGFSTITQYMFAGCNGLTSISIPKSVKSIAVGAFKDCPNLTKLFYDGTIAQWVSMINREIGAYCNQQVHCSDGIVTSSSRFYDYNDMALSLTSDGTMIFSGTDSIPGDSYFGHAGLPWSNLTKYNNVLIMGGIQKIGEYAFRKNKLTSITIPKSIKTIGQFALPNSIKDIYYEGDEASWNDISISGRSNACLDTATIHYNCFVPHYQSNGQDDNGDTSISRVRYFSEWNAESQTAYFGDDKLHLGATVTEKTDTSFLENLDSLLHEYVLVKTQPRTDSKVGPEILISISSVETQMGTVTAVNDTTMTIADTTYSIPDNWSFVDSYKNKKVVYHISGNKLVGIEELKSSTELLQYWDSTNHTAKLGSVDYKLSPLANSEETEILKENVGKKIYFLYDSNQFIYIIKEVQEDFNRYVYQAKSLDRTEFPAIANIRATMNQDTATDLFISGLKDSGFEVAMGISDLCKLYSDSIDDVTALSDFAIEPKDLYEAVILNALEDDLDASIDVLDDQLETYLGWGKDLTSLVESTLKTNYGIDYVSGRDSLASLSTEAKQKIIETMEEEFRKKYPLISGAGDLSTGLGIVLDSVDNIEDCWNRFSSCVFARRASESVKEVVHQAYKESLKTNNFYLQSALADCVEIIDSSAAEFALRALSDTCMVAGKRSMNYLVKEIFWEDVKNSIYIALPGVAIIQCGYKGGQLVSNILFSTDNISEKYAKMKIVNSVTSVFEKASSSLKANFLNQQSSHTAQTYLSSVDFLFRLWAQDCDEAYNFVDTLDRAMISNVAKLFDSTYYNDTKDAINMKKNTYATQRSMAEVAWIDLLDEDYPNSGLSDQYQWIIDQHNESLRKKIKVACPVNVHVYDSNGKLVAYAENGRVSSTGPVTIALNDDVKTIYFYDDAKYNIQYKQDLRNHT